MKTYILFTGIANIVAGGPIYVRNKIRYLEERGWNVVVFPIDDGEVYIHGLERYKGQCQAFIWNMPGEYTRRQRKALLEQLSSKVVKESTEIIVETGTDYSSYWGSLLAQMLCARHFVLWLDEKNPNIGNREWEFLAYKYRRRELACISKRAMKEMFCGYMDISEKEAYALSCCCTNVVEEYGCELADNFPEGDYVIGSIGRLEKPFVPAIIDGVIEFANSVSDKKVVVCFFGGADKKVLNAIKSAFNRVQNVELLITGYLYPLPAAAIKKCDIFISGAGSVWASERMGVPTIRMDMYRWIPEGYAIDPINLTYEKCSRGSRIIDYLNQVLIYRELPDTKMDNRDEWGRICQKFDEHMKFIDEMPESYVEFPEKKIVQLGMNWKRKVKKWIRGCLGVSYAEYVFALYKRVKSAIC